MRHRLQEHKAEHPFWGYRRIWASLRFVGQRAVNKQRLRRRMRAPHLWGKPQRALRAKRTPTGSNPRPTKPNAWWGSDMTKRLVEDGGGGYIVVVLDWSTNKSVGDYAGTPGPARHWLAALDRAVSRQFPEGARDHGLSLRSDNGWQPTAQAFTSDHTPKGNADTERLMRTRKAACLWLSEWTSPVGLMRALDAWIADDNEQYWHST